MQETTGEVLRRRRRRRMKSLRRACNKEEENMSKVIVITGATAGIGRDAALHFARQGHTVFAAGRRRAALETLEKEAGAGTLRGVVVDVTDADSIARFRDEVQRQAGRVDVLVNNAGY